MQSLQGKTVLITGANRGIGRGFVEYCVAAGAQRIYACARDVTSLDDLQSMHGDVVQSCLLDVTNNEHIETLATPIEQLDILVNNAGIVHDVYNCSDIAIPTVEKEMAVHLYGPMRLTQALLPVLRKSNDALIINISSIAGISNLPNIGPYSVSKAALHSYTQGLRMELSASTINVIGVYPGPHDTRMTANMAMDKPQPDNVAIQCFAQIAQGAVEVFPDTFSQTMYDLFLEHPSKLEAAFAQIATAEAP